MKGTSNFDISLVKDICSDAVKYVTQGFDDFSNKAYPLPDKKLYSTELEFLTEKFLNALLRSRDLLQKSQLGKNINPKRLSYANTEMDRLLSITKENFPQAASVWVLNGLIFHSQIAGLKRLAGLSKKGEIIDVFNSASSLSLGAENPWLLEVDRYEDFWGIKDNLCPVYHPGIRQTYVLRELAKLYPADIDPKDITVHAESSGTIADTIAIESAVAYAEKTHGNDKILRILAVDGSWCGSYGTAREGTGFGVDFIQKRRIGKNVWVDRCLPAPTTANAVKFLTVLKEKLSSGEAAGLYLEPDIIGDLGILTVDKNLLLETRNLLAEYKLPLVADCVQQLGRTGGYWGENVENILQSYPLLVLTAAKSASNGQPFSFTVMPKQIADAAYPLSQLTTNQMNGPLLRSITVAQILKDSRLQNWVRQKADRLEAIAADYGFQLNEKGLRGKLLNRSIYVGDNDTVKLAQIALLIDDGILVGALPESIRFQPMLLELSETNELSAHIVFSRIRKVMSGNISKEVKTAYEQMKNTVSGLAR